MRSSVIPEGEKRPRTSILSIDVEDGLNIAMRDLFNIEMPPTDRVIKNVNTLLFLFGENNVRATFFILGEIASSFPGLVKKIATAGHEVAVHGYYHDQFFSMSRTKAKEDISRAKSLIEDITGKRVYGFRAPAFSISAGTSWALEVIMEAGFKYDSSIVPVKTGRYGWPGFYMDIHRLLLPGGDSLIEVPLSVVKIFGKMIPACGGGYLRHFPYRLTRKAFLTVQEQRPVIVYLHPYELDKEKYPDYFYTAISEADIKKKVSLLFYRLNKNSVEKKLENLLKEFQFKPAIDIIDDMEMYNGISTRQI